MIYFVGEEYFKENTPAGENVDFKRVLPWVKVAANTKVRDVLGRVFYAEMLQKYNDENLTNEEVTLIEYVKDVVAWFALQMALPDINKPVNNKGQQKQKGDFSDAVESNDETRGIDSYLSTAKHYLKELKDYLEENGSLYATYKAEINKKSKGFEDTNKPDDSYNDSILII